MRCEIRVRDQLDSRWSPWFDGMTIAVHDASTTIISGPLTDQAALHGVLAKIRDLGLTLLSVQAIEPASGDTRP